jgi:hypothetical protein
MVEEAEDMTILFDSALAIVIVLAIFLTAEAVLISVHPRGLRR